MSWENIQEYKALHLQWNSKNKKEINDTSSRLKLLYIQSNT